MNIYITKANEEWLREQQSLGHKMSGIINELLVQRRQALEHMNVAAPAVYGRVVRSSAEVVKLPSLQNASTLISPETPEMLTMNPLDDKVVLDVNEEPKR